MNSIILFEKDIASPIRQFLRKRQINCYNYFQMAVGKIISALSVRHYLQSERSHSGNIHTATNILSGQYTP